MDLSVDKKVFVFDWDGTIFDSMSVKRQVFAGAVAEYTAKIGHNVPLKEIMAIYIYSKYLILGREISEKKTDTRVPQCRQTYIRNLF